MSTEVKIRELKNGDKFYGMDGIVYKLIDINIDENNLDHFSYTARIVGSKDIMEYSISGKDVINQYATRYSRRDKNSFIFGFKSSMKLCLEHMGKFDIENAELDSPLIQYTTMDKMYKKWKKNEEFL